MKYADRKLPRLKNYNYATPGAYFITICTHSKVCSLGAVLPGNVPGEAYVKYSPLGELARRCILDVEAHYVNIRLDNWVIMPNHIHLLIRITEPPTSSDSIAYDIPNVVGKLKAAITRNAAKTLSVSGKLWQSSYHDHIVRNDAEYQRIWRYIAGNPSVWNDDCFHVE